MPWPPRFLFTSGRIAIDFALTGGEGERAYWERWHEPADLADWAREHPSLAVETRVSPGDLARARELREAIWWGAQAVIRGAPIPAEVEETFARMADRKALVPVLRDGRMQWAGGASGGQLLATVSRDAIELFGTELRERLRECENPQCALLFVDLSRPGRRRWCTMRRCGNLNKIARYRTGRGLADDGDDDDDGQKGGGHAPDARPRQEETS